MNNKTKFKKYLRGFVLVVLAISFIPWQTSQFSFLKTTQAAAVNLINDGNFNQDISKSWLLWKNASSTRSYILARGYETPFGYGPYSLAVKATGPSPEMYDAGISSTGLSKFTVTANKDYLLSFYVKSSEATSFRLHLEDATSHAALTEEKTITASTTWTKQQVSLTPSSGGVASLSLFLGSLADEATIHFDNINLFENDATLSTKQISGFIGDKNKTLTITNGNLFSLDELKIELPYVDEQTGVTGVKLFSASQKNGSNISFDIPERTFSGIGKLYAGDKMLGQFNYSVSVRISEVSPNPVLVNEDLVIYGTGFSPVKTQNFVILKASDSSGKMTEKWISPHIIDNSLSQMVIKLPVGIVNGPLSVRSYYNNLEGVSVEQKSNIINYLIKPVIFNLEWSQAGYEQIGDKITITGKGIANHPVVKFYDDDDKLIASLSAKVVSINDTDGYEKIEVATPQLLNKLKVTVKVGNSESDQADALNYTARPVLQSVQTGKSRRSADNNLQISAAKAGSTIKLSGKGFKSTGEAFAEFPGLHDSVVRVNIPADKIDPKGNWLEVVVPKEAQNGQIRVELNGQTSNYIPLEIIPNIISTVPLTPFPGEEVMFWTNGVSLDKEDVTVYFQLNNKDTVAVKPFSLTESEYGDVIVRVMTPKAISSDSSAIKLQSGFWMNDEMYGLETSPYIERASMDKGTKIMIINGHGFSNTLVNNKINYKYADGTVVEAKAKILEIKNTSEGQEIKIQILDDYYYGYVSVTVGTKTSNEINVGPAVITKIERRVQFVAAENRVMGVFYISGRNFGNEGDVRIGDNWATTHYRSNTFIIAVVEQEAITNNPVIVTKAN